MSAEPERDCGVIGGVREPRGAAVEESVGSTGLPSSPRGRDRLDGRRSDWRMRPQLWGRVAAVPLPSALSLTGSGQCPASEGHGPAYEHKLIFRTSAGPPAQSVCLHGRLRSLSWLGDALVEKSDREREKASGKGGQSGKPRI